MTTDAEIEAKRQELFSELLRDLCREAITECSTPDACLLEDLVVELLAKPLESAERATKLTIRLGDHVLAIIDRYVRGAVEEELAEWIARGPERAALAADERRFEQRREV